MPVLRSEHVLHLATHEIDAVYGEDAVTHLDASGRCGRLARLEDRDAVAVVEAQAETEGAAYQCNLVRGRE